MTRWRVDTEEWGDEYADTETPQEAAELVINDMTVGNGETVYDGQSWDAYVTKAADWDGDEDPTPTVIRVDVAVSFTFSGTVITEEGQ